MALHPGHEMILIPRNHSMASRGFNLCYDGSLKSSDFRHSHSQSPSSNPPLH
ncbi:1374_t:CDS:2 [Funneliformis caledonium]|uniref:1374_t:CDS:1 n=1 Tax=Funneliformis caledonium TaxID=1117310 RepID=A0A9N8VPP6_9GLOM|nr:1374_t:CDS:2 [Funneliformis caledonium]